MADLLTVIMYHYVRDFKQTRFPDIKGLDLQAFREQLQYLSRHHTFVSVADCLAALDEGADLPSGAVLLTFDDGYADHYRYVFPELVSMGIEGLFFVPARPVIEGVVLDVNKVQFILACAQKPAEVYGALRQKFGEIRGRFGLRPMDEYIAGVNLASRFDSPEVIAIKRLLQRDLPPEARSLLLADLFRDFVTGDEGAFSQDLYLGGSQLREMALNGMRFGHHGFDHRWLTSLTREERAEEIRAGLDFLAGIGECRTGWVMGYPFGDCDPTVMHELREAGCSMAFTTIPDLARMIPENRLSMPRLDTNDLPKEADAPQCGWTVRALSSAAETHPE